MTSTRFDADTLAQLLRHRSVPGRSDSITDVGGVRVGHQNVRRPAADGSHASDVVSGVTAVAFDQLNAARRTLPAGMFVGNGHGKMIGATQLAELGEIETPILLTSTLSAFAAADTLVGWVLDQPGRERSTTLNPVVAECNDGWLSDIRARAITAADVFAALNGASHGTPAEGTVGAGSGMVCFDYKGGIGSASRQATLDGEAVTVGVLTLTNFSGSPRLGTLDLTAQHVLGHGAPHDAHGRAGAGTHEPHATSEQDDHTSNAYEQEGNSCIVLVVTDAPVDSRQLTRLAARGVYAMGRVGAGFTNGSGDYGIAVSTAEPAAAPADHLLDPLLAATLEAAEAALWRSLLAATTTYGQRGRVAHALPWSVLPDRG